jgi:hypothetical protein
MAQQRTFFFGSFGADVVSVTSLILLASEQWDVDVSAAAVPQANKDYVCLRR